MFTIRHALLSTCLLSSAAFGQTQLVRGDLDVLQGTQLFRLDCTNIMLTSSTVNLQQLHDQSRQQNIEYEMQVVDVSGTGTTLDVVSATAIPEIFGMGNLRLGRSDTWEVSYAPGSLTAMFVTAESFTSYAPFGLAGTWLLGSVNLFVASGTVPAGGKLQVAITPPNDPGLVGATFTGQAAIADPAGNLVIANASCKTVRSN